MTPFKPGKTSLDTQGWHACLELSLEPETEKTKVGKTQSGKTRLGQTSRFGPLTVQQPFYPEGDVCHLYLLHPPGGLVGGDCLELTVNSNKNSTAFITTPGATKFYRSQGLAATQKQTFNCDCQSVLEWFPQETILFDHAVAKIETIINQESDSIFMGWDILCLGLPAIKQRFESGKLVSTVCIRQNDIPVFVDRLGINHAKDLDAPAGLRGFPVSASFWATGVNDTLFKKIQTAVKPDKHQLFGATLINDILVARCLVNSPQEAKDLFIQIWKDLRPELTGQPICAPRIWNT